MTLFNSSTLGLVAAFLCCAAAPAVAADYREALEACQQASEKAEDPTDFECDWKTVLEGAPGSTLSGKFEYREKGFSGQMTIIDPVGEPGQIGFMTAAENENASTCSGSFGASRNDNDELVATMDEPEGCEVRVVSVPGPAIVKVTASESCSSFCGMGAAFDGTWQLVD